MRKKKPPAVNPLAKSFLTPVSRSTLTADICRKLLSHLIRGDWSEGERIPPERELCQQLGVGRVSLREALKALEIMGMIETRLGDGTFVCRRSEFLSRPLLWAITGSDLTGAQELVEARQLIEVELAGFAAVRATAENLKELGHQLDRMQANRTDVTSFQEADIQFHLAVSQAAHNRILQNALQLIRNLMQQWIGGTLNLKGVADEALAQHRQIFTAISKRNPERARLAMRAHLNAMALHLTKEIKSMPAASTR
ncbi:MAG: FadR family transcriptional regulator [Acidobacteria bacterium]|nr:FadR family transcriptional regulator [Acidobacteriota bacterium]